MTQKTPRKSAMGPIPLDHRCPPLRVRHKQTGVITNWSTLFRNRIDEFEPWYRPGTDEQMQHALRVRRFEAKMALSGGDPFVTTSPGFTSFGDVVDGEAFEPGAG